VQYADQNRYLHKVASARGGTHPYRTHWGEPRGLRTAKIGKRKYGWLKWKRRGVHVRCTLWGRGKKSSSLGWDKARGLCDRGSDAEAV